MGVDANCCRRPQTTRKKDLKIYRGLSQKNRPEFHNSFNDKEDNFRTYHPTKAFQTNDYFNSIYENNNTFSNNNYQQYSAYYIEPLSNQVYTQNYYTQPSYDNTQYINSYTSFPQQNNVYQAEYSPINNNNSPPINFDFTQSETVKYSTYNSPQYINSQPYEYEYNNSSSQYYLNQPVEYNNYNNDNYSQNISINESTPTDNNLNLNFTSYSQNDELYSANTYIGYIPNDYSNYESNLSYIETQSQKVYNEPIQIKYYDPQPVIQKTIYVCKPKQYIEKVQYIEPETQIQQTMYSPNKQVNNEINEFKEYKTQKEPEQYNLSEARPQPFKYLENERRDLETDESEIDREFIEEENISQINDVKIIKSAKIEKNKENTACQVPGFINNFLSKIFNKE